MRPTTSWLGTTAHSCLVFSVQCTSRSRNGSSHTGGWSPTKNELKGGALQATSPPAILAAESVAIGPKMPRSAKAWESVSLVLPLGRTPAAATEARRRGSREQNILASARQFERRGKSLTEVSDGCTWRTKRPLIYQHDGTNSNI